MELTHESYRHRLLYSPNRQWQEDPHDLFVYQTNTRNPTFTIVMPIFNQEDIIQENLNRIVNLTGGTFEVILILDGCKDRTSEKVIQWCKTTQFQQNMYLLRVIESNVELFETSCDNLGFILARGKYIIEIQCDMRIELKNYNIFLTLPMEIYPDLIGVSGRCCHGINSLTRGEWEGKYGKIDKHSVPLNNRIYLSHTANRGPLALRKSMLESLGYLDELNYVLGDDDHDLFSRAWVQHKWRTAYVPIDYESPPEWGATRKPKPRSTEEILERRFTKQGFFSMNRETIQYPESQTRVMDALQVEIARAKLLA